jgi:hypothetical protein
MHAARGGAPPARHHAVGAASAAACVYAGTHWASHECAPTSACERDMIGGMWCVVFGLGLVHEAAAAAAKSGTIAPNFVGLSIEVPSVLGMIGTASAPRHALAQALKNMAELTAGPHPGPILRLGGNSADSSCWHTVNSGGTCTRTRDHVKTSSPCCAYNITEKDLEAYAEFAKIAPNISYVIDTDLGAGPDPARGAAHIAALTSNKLWPIVSGIEIGNECDLFSSNGHRNSSYSFTQYEDEFAQYLAAYKTAGLPEKMIQGAAFCCFKPDFDAGLQSYVRKYAADLATLSYHSYSGSHCGMSKVTPTQMLSNVSSSGRAKKYSFVAADGAAANVPFVIGEGNSVACGGMPVRHPNTVCVVSLSHSQRLS